MTEEQKAANAKYFIGITTYIKEGGIYIWPDHNEKYIVRGRKFYGTKRGVEIMKDHTPKTFHKNIVKNTGEDNE